MASAPAPANLPLFYKDLAPLSSVDHADFRARPLDSAEFLVGQHAIPLTSDEFVSACRFFPIVFSAGDNPVPLALMGLNESINTFVDDEGNLLLEPDKLEDAFAWFQRNVENGVIPANNTAMEFDAIRAEFYAENNAAFFMYCIWDLGSRAFPSFGVPSQAEEFDKNWGWIAAPPVEEGGEPSSLTHPIVYAVSADVEQPDLAVRLLGFA